MPKQDDRPRPPSDTRVLVFITLLCCFCALLLAIVAFGLATPQKNAKEFDQSKQMLIAAKILNPAGFFEILDKQLPATPARFDAEQKILVPDPKKPLATAEQIKQVAALRIRPLLTDQKGEISTLEKKNLTLATYLSDHKKTGYARLPEKLFYAILGNEKTASAMTTEEIAKDLSKAYSIVIPVSGFGLWSSIYGYIALEKNGNTVIGTTWYEHGETPGLGANITEPWWQNQFYHKLIFQESPGGKTDPQTAEMGIIVVKGKVKDVYGSSPKSKSAVDGMSGATLTGDGVTAAYRDSLQPYRPLLLQLQKTEPKKEEKKKNERSFSIILFYRASLEK